MSENWTRGPWRANGDKIESTSGACRARIAIIDDGAGTNPAANAHLIAAAPELYEALQTILPYVPISSASEGGAVARSGNVIAADKVRAALKKARGES